MDRDSGPTSRLQQDWSDLAPRIISALVLVGCALFAAYLGGWIFVFLWTLAAAVVVQEWLRLTDDERCLARTLPQVAGLTLMGAFAGMGYWRGVMPVVFAMIFGAIVLARAPRR